VPLGIYRFPEVICAAGIAACVPPYDIIAMARPALLMLAVLMALHIVPAAAEIMPVMPYYAVNPNSPVTPRAANPVQEQILQNYRTQLQQSQRAMPQNPAVQFDVNRQLNALGPGSLAPPSTTALIPAPNLGTVPSIGGAHR
jgi:hypothetical protein